MFTGIITHLGKISNITDKTLTITTDRSFLSKIKKGDSVSVNGICLTAVNVGKDFFRVDVMPETHKKTNIKYLKIADLINLELPATPTSFLSGHIVQGHIDGIGQITKINSHLMTIAVPKNISHYLVEKGSIAVNGVSLTIIKTRSDYFTAGLIPHTWKNTMLHILKKGDFVNIEVDVLAKYLK